MSNNMGHIYSHFCETEEAQRCLEWLRIVLEVSQSCDEDMLGNECMLFRLNIFILHGQDTAAWQPRPHRQAHTLFARIALVSTNLYNNTENTAKYKIKFSKMLQQQRNLIALFSTSKNLRLCNRNTTGTTRKTAGLNVQPVKSL